MVADLLKLWDGVQLQTVQSTSIFSSRIVRAALVYISSDLPATRKVCGFYSIKTTYGCSKCLKKFPGTLQSTNYSGYESHNWPPRSLSAHISVIKRASKATSQSARERIEKEIGVCNSELLKLPNFDIIRYHLVDPMHNLYLGKSNSKYGKIEKSLLITIFKISKDKLMT